LFSTLTVTLIQRTVLEHYTERLFMWLGVMDLYWIHYTYHFS